MAPAVRPTDRHPADCDPEEMKELFTDPMLRKPEKETFESCATCGCSHKISTPEVEMRTSCRSETEIVAVEVNKTAIENTGHLMTKRITIAGGFLDIALFTANCEQLKFVLELGDFHIYYNQVIGLLITSLTLQLLVGLTMFLLGFHSSNGHINERYANVLNHITMGLVALITIVNIFIGTFGPKGTIMARCLGAFAYPNTSGPVWLAYLNITRNYMAEDL